MNPADFSTACPGRLVKIPEGTWAFVPNRMPREIPLVHPIPILIEQASRGLGRLFERADRLPNPDLLIEPLIKKEAEFSSRIEGTIATQEELALLGTPGFEKTLRPEVQEVHNYAEALRHGLKELHTLPICLRLIRDLHGKLLEGVRGQDERPGEFRTVQNQVSKPNQAIIEARYVPPPVSEMERCLDEFEKDIHELVSSGMPQLVQAALIHYQFEAIHPFRDGNGRIGRMLIPLFLAERGLLPFPLLHVSAYFEQHRVEYADHLLQLSQTGNYVPWVEFFLMGLSQEANRSLKLCWDLLNLREQYLTLVQIKRVSSLLPKLVDFLFAAPVITVPLAAKIANVTYAAAKANVLKLEEAGILTPVPEIKSIKIWKAERIFKLLSQ
jgi:cell filamentation protein, protein adenylyltransferase